MKTLSSSGELASIHKRLALLDPADSPLWGSMSANQMLCHLRDAFRCPLGERVPPRFKANALPAPVFKWLALWLPLKWPPGVRTPPEADQQIGGTPPIEFEADRTTLVAKMDQFAQSSGPWSPHPMWGHMTTAEWMRWGYLHTDHHLRQFGR
jgi:hypothetical protein